MARPDPYPTPPGGDGAWRPAGYRGRRRAGAAGPGHPARDSSRRRVTLVAAAVGAVLLGTAAFGRTLPDRPEGTTEPPPEQAADSGATAGYERRGVAPSRAIAPSRPSVPPAVSGALPADIDPAPEPTGPEGGEGTGPGDGSPTAGPAGTGPPTADPSGPERSDRQPPPPVRLSFEAESAELSGFVRLFPVEDASGGDVIGMIGVGRPNHVRFTEVEVETAGEYEVTFDYVSAPARQAVVVVNDQEPVTVEFPSLGDWRTVGSVTATVELAAGQNVIWFGNPVRPAPALDRITVTDSAS